jgi:hypothetical protein
MNNGMIRTLLPLMILLLPLAAFAEGEIYKVVDDDGNVTYTDQRPSTGAEPMDLPELSVIKTDTPETVPLTPDASQEEQAGKPTPRELRRQFSDFRILQPQPEETFWGTGNQVTVAWGSSQPMLEGLSTRLYVDGEAQEAPAAGSVTLTLNRGEHQVYAELLDERKRRILTTDTVTFFVKQHSALFNPGP